MPLYGTSLFTIGMLNLTAFFLFGMKESSYVLLASGICFWFGRIFVRSIFSKKTLNHYRKGRKGILDILHTIGGLACVLVGILGCTYGWIKPKLWKAFMILVLKNIFFYSIVIQVDLNTVESPNSNRWIVKNLSIVKNSGDKNLFIT